MTFSLVMHQYRTLNATPLYRATNIGQDTFPERSQSANHTSSSWLDLAEGQLRLDRLNRNGAGETFFPWASPFLAKQESVTAAVLR